MLRPNPHFLCSCSIFYCYYLDIWLNVKFYCNNSSQSIDFGSPNEPGRGFNRTGRTRPHRKIRLLSASIGSTIKLNIFPCLPFFIPFCFFCIFLFIWDTSLMVIFFYLLRNPRTSAHGSATKRNCSCFWEWGIF